MGFAMHLVIIISSSSSSIIIIIIKFIWWHVSMSTCDSRIMGASGHVEG